MDPAGLRGLADDLGRTGEGLGRASGASVAAQKALRALHGALVEHLRRARLDLARAPLPDDRGPREWLRLESEQFRVLLAEARERLRADPDDPRGAYARTTATLRLLVERTRNYAEIYERAMAPYARRKAQEPLK